jgi:hypothetical protein
LLGCEQSPLVLGVAEELELGLDGVKPIISLQRLTCFSEDRRVSSQELSIGALGLTSSISSTMDSAGGVGYEQTQQLDLLIPRLQNRRYGLS